VTGLQIAAFRNNFCRAPVQFDALPSSSLTGKREFDAIASKERTDTVSVYEKSSR
jgi:hypothetical protein